MSATYVIRKDSLSDVPPSSYSKNIKSFSSQRALDWKALAVKGMLRNKINDKRKRYSSYMSGYNTYTGGKTYNRHNQTFNNVTQSQDFNYPQPPPNSLIDILYEERITYPQELPVSDASNYRCMNANQPSSYQSYPEYQNIDAVSNNDMQTYPTSQFNSNQCSSYLNTSTTNNMHYYGNVSQEDYSNYQSEPANNYIPVPTPYMPLQTNQNGAVRNYPTNYYYSGNNASTGESTQQVSAVPSQQLPMQSSSPTRLSQHVKSNDYYPFNGSSQYASNDLRSYVSLESCQQDKPCTCSLPDHQYQAKCQKHSNLKSSVYQNTPRTVVDEVDNKAATTILQVTPSKDLRTTQKQLSEGKKSYDSTPSFDESGVRSVSIRTVHFMLDKILEEEGLSGHSTNKT